MSFPLSSVRDDYKPLTIHSTPPVAFEFIENIDHDTELPLQPNYIQGGHMPIRHPKSQRKIGNVQACNPSSSYDFIDASMCIVTPTESKTASDQMIQSIRSMMYNIQDKHPKD